MRPDATRQSADGGSADSPRVPFARVAIVGLGLIGGSVALAVKRRWPSVQVVAIDRPDVIAAAIRMQIVDEGGGELHRAAGAQLVLLAAPVLQNVAALRELPACVPGPAVVTDAGSTKRAIQEAARPDLFDDRPWIVTATDRTCSSALASVTQFVTGLRAIPKLMDAADHDRLVAYISHLPQLAVSALMHVVGTHADVDGLALAGRGLRDTTRLASSPAATWRDILTTNGDNISSALDDLISALQALKREAGDPAAALERTFVSAARWKGVLEHN